ncbi:Hypothetical predicted protein [Prunus dulcis]|uniref:Uncharacterized protein n=1 Tax=Prunus dulcis TaxID=3755 RepID=A0A5E4G6Q9_PRUDU|nr:Hypothetical predicted protein [Prunus dulcis]
MGAPNIWMLGLGPRWTIFEFSKYSNIGNSVDIPPAELQNSRRKYLPPNFNSLCGNTSHQTSTPSAQLCFPKCCKEGGRVRKEKIHLDPSFCKRSGRPSDNQFGAISSQNHIDSGQTVPENEPHNCPAEVGEPLRQCLVELQSPPITWNSICKPKDLGALGFRRLNQEENR